MIIQAVINESISVAQSLLGEKEIKQNRSPKIDLIQREFGYLGVAYCALFVQYCYKLACVKYDYPFTFPGTASSQTLFDWAKECTYTDKSLVRAGHLVVWRKFMKWQGHVGIVIANPSESLIPNSISTIEGNTSNNDYGSQSDGDGIYQRIRYTNKIDFDVDSFWLRGFVNTNLVLERAMT